MITARRYRTLYEVIKTTLYYEGLRFTEHQARRLAWRACERTNGFSDHGTISVLRVMVRRFIRARGIVETPRDRLRAMKESQALPC